MQPHECIHDIAGRLYWLALLLTGDSDFSIAAAADAIDSECDPRLAVIAASLVAIRVELEIAERRMSLCTEEPAIPSAPWPLHAGCCAELLDALFAMDLFPRCALILTVLERLNDETAAVLLRCPKHLVAPVREIGLRKLTANLTAAHALSF